MHNYNAHSDVWKSVLLTAFALSLVVAATGSADAQVDRNQLGKRLRRMELAWQQADAATRARATPALQAAVRSFFSLQFRSAAAQLVEHRGGPGGRLFDRGPDRTGRGGR